MTQDAALKRGSFAIVADSGCDLPLAWFEQNGVGLVPFHISLDGRDFLDCVEVAPADLYVALTRPTQRLLILRTNDDETLLNL